MDNNRTILAVVLIVLLWSGYSLFFAPQTTTQPSSQSVEVDTAVAKHDAVVPATSPETVSDTEKQKSIDFDSSQKNEVITVVSDYFEIELTSLGAAIKSIHLKKYKQDNSETSDTFFLFDGESKNLSTLLSSGSEGLSIPSNLNYNIKNFHSDKIVLNNERIELVFYANNDDFTFTKTYKFYPSSYSFDVDIDVINNSKNTIGGKINLSLITPKESEEKKQLYSFVGPQSFDGNDLLDDKIKDIDKTPKIYGNNIIWSGYTSKYFFTVINPKKSSDQLFISSNDNFVENKFVSPYLTIQPGEQQALHYAVYAGPKQTEYLASSGNQFEEAIHYGFFHPLAKPLIVVLKFFYNFIGNYGFAIILLTVCIKIIFWPLTQKSYKSMKGMQKLQPEMKRLREKYGSDKQRLNQEMMTFYKEHKVNPLGGCLPMLIQIPVFFALYRVLLGSIELRHAPFMLWITDLSAKDPYYVTPLIMGVTMFLQQKMTPTNMDPTQEKIMLMMPVVFTFMFLNFPSGLVIYWLTNNLLTILQQYLIRRQPD